MGGRFDTTARLAERQYGRVSWQQLVERGIDRHLIQRWLDDGRLRRVHHGIYAVGHAAPSLRGDYMAAILAGGVGSVISHRAAAHLLRLRRSSPPPPPEITVPTKAGRRRDGIVIHRVGALHPYDTYNLDGLPITAVPRVLLDLAPSLDLEDLTRACHEAWVHHHTRPTHIEACIARNPNKKGAAKLRHASGADVTLSDLEDAFVALLKAHELPMPRTNIDVRGDKVDCHRPALGLTIELHSYRFHGSRYAYEKDIARRRRSHHIAFSYGDVVDRPQQTVVELHELLAQERPKVCATSGR